MNIRFIRTKEEEDRLDALLEEVRHKEIRVEPERDGMWYAIMEHLERNDEEDDWIDALLGDHANDERGMEMIENRNKILYD